MSAIWEWLTGPESDCLRLVSAMALLVVWVRTKERRAGQATGPSDGNGGRDERCGR